MEPLQVVVGGATGKVGREICRALLREPGFALVGAVARHAAGRDLGEALGLSEHVGLDVSADVSGALARATGAQILVDFSTAEALREHLPTALGHGLAPVVGTTGYKRADLDAWARTCRTTGVGGAFISNFAIGAMLMMRFAAEARRFFPHAEIIEMHHHTKLDAPSGTAARTRSRLEAAAGDLKGPPVPVHSVRLPGLVAHQEVIFGGPGQVLTIRHDATSREAYVPGVFMACKWVIQHPGQVALDLEDLAR